MIESQSIAHKYKSVVILRRRNFSLEIVLTKYGCVSLRDSIEFRHFFRLCNEYRTEVHSQAKFFLAKPNFFLLRMHQFIWHFVELLKAGRLGQNLISAVKKTQH